MFMKIIKIKKKKREKDTTSFYFTSVSEKEIPINTLKNKQNKNTNNIFLVDMYNDFIVQ